MLMFGSIKMFVCKCDTSGDFDAVSGVVCYFRKLYVLISMALCLLVCCLVLFFLFPRSVTVTPVSVLSVMVYFGQDSVDLHVAVSKTTPSPALTVMYLPVKSCPVDFFPFVCPPSTVI